jgi:pimeloyl-ACP methyl ester carboxylesterase
MAVYRRITASAPSDVDEPPALLLYGVGSFPFEQIISDRLRALRPDLRLITVHGAGHNVHGD